MTCVVASVVVATALVTIRRPIAAGATAAFPTVSATLIGGPASRASGRCACARRARPQPPCYLTFCLVVVAAAPTVGLPAIFIALLACLAAGRITWRAVPLPPRVAAAH